MRQARRQDKMVEVILFDLGGVLVHWDGNAGLTNLVGRSFTEEDARQFWFLSPAVQRFEKGQVTPEEFALETLSELSLDLSIEEWLEEFISWDRGPFPGATELLKGLAVHHRLGCLSNNNELHWNRLCEVHGFGRYFRHQYLSHELGLFKPNLAIFEHVVRDLEIPSGSVLYLDDSPENVAAASEVGMRARMARGLDETRAILEDEGLLSFG